MKKLFAVLVLAFFSAVAGAQTFTVSGLTIKNLKYKGVRVEFIFTGSVTEDSMNKVITYAKNEIDVACALKHGSSDRAICDGVGGQAIEAKVEAFAKTKGIDRMRFKARTPQMS